MTTLRQPTLVFRVSRERVPCPCVCCPAPVCWRDAWCGGSALSSPLPIWHLFEHNAGKLLMLFPIAFSAQIKGRICYVGFASLRGGSSVFAVTCNQLLPFCMWSLEATGGKGSWCSGSPGITGTAAARWTHT